MKKTLNLFGIIAIVVIIGVSFVSCDNAAGSDNDIIPARWQGAYIAPDGWTFTILSTGAIFWTDMNWSSRPNGSMSGARIANGGTGSAPGVTAEWVYLAINGTNRGIIINFTPSVAGMQSLIGMGQWGVEEVLYMLQDFGGTLSPTPNATNFQGFPVPEESDGFWVAR